jgi:hypothetical protein
MSLSRSLTLALIVLSSAFAGFPAANDIGHPLQTAPRGEQLLVLPSTPGTGAPDSPHSAKIGPCLEPNGLL